jgi:hypothetical protein
MVTSVAGLSASKSEARSISDLLSKLVMILN